MLDAFQSGGILMYPLLLIALAVVFLGVRTAMEVRNGAAPERVTGGLRAILFWGGMSVILGLLGTIVGLVQITQAIHLARGAEPVLLAGGIGVSLVTLIFGLVIFLLSATIWFSLRQWEVRGFRARA